MTEKKILNLVHLLNLAGLPRPGLCLGGNWCCSIGLARLSLNQAQDGVTIIGIRLVQLLSMMLTCVSSRDLVAYRLIIRDEHLIFDRLIFVRHSRFPSL